MLKALQAHVHGQLQDFLLLTAHVDLSCAPTSQTTRKRPSHASNLLCEQSPKTRSPFNTRITPNLRADSRMRYEYVPPGFPPFGLASAYLPTKVEEQPTVEPGPLGLRSPRPPRVSGADLPTEHTAQLPVLTTLCKAPSANSST
jgi:hypothetical protein